MFQTEKLCLSTANNKNMYYSVTPKFTEKNWEYHNEALRKFVFNNFGEKNMINSNISVKLKAGKAAKFFKTLQEVSEYLNSSDHAVHDFIVRQIQIEYYRYTQTLVTCIS